VIVAFALVIVNDDAERAGDHGVRDEQDRLWAKVRA
jgi:hypothetical protein